MQNISLLDPKEELRQKYDRFVPRYDLVTAVLEPLGLRRLRHKLVRLASGKILEVAVGTGKNLPFYDETLPLTVIDLSPTMLKLA